jgi:hypothetical protein
MTGMGEEEEQGLWFKGVSINMAHRWIREITNPASRKGSMTFAKAVAIVDPKSTIKIERIERIFGYLGISFVPSSSSSSLSSSSSTTTTMQRCIDKAQRVFRMNSRILSPQMLTPIVFYEFRRQCRERARYASQVREMLKTKDKTEVLGFCMDKLHIPGMCYISPKDFVIPSSLPALNASSVTTTKSEKVVSQ